MKNTGERLGERSLRENTAEMGAAGGCGMVLSKCVSEIGRRVELMQHSIDRIRALP